MRELNFDAPLNSLSFGNVSLNFLREIYKKEIKVNLFAANDSMDLSAFNKLDKNFVEWLNKCNHQKLKNFSDDIPTLKVWHIKGSERKLGNNQFLNTFYEVDSPTIEEINTVKAQKHVFFSSSESAEIFKQNGCENVSYVPLGFDTDFSVVDRDFINQDVVHFGLIGKFERRKNTAALINLWLKLFGDNPKFQLTCLVGNPFFSNDQMNSYINQAVQGKRWNNINFLPRLSTNEEMNLLMNSIDIDLSGLSNGEGWNLPAFNCTALGKWSIVTNCSSHKDWANEKNSIIVEPNGKQPCYDNIFFKEGLAYNQGNYSKIDESSVIDGIERALKVCKQENTEGLKLQEQFTYQKSVDSILTKIF